MIGLIAEGLLGGVVRSALAGPCAILTGIAAIFAICGCVKCMRCRMRDCGCCKRMLRVTGHDEFDDFELMLIVHEALFEKSVAKLSTIVQVTAGRHQVCTDANSNGIFQQPLDIMVEQGTQHILVDLMDSNKRVLATLTLNTVEDVVNPSVLRPEAQHSPIVFAMKQKSKTTRNPKIKLTMVVQQGDDIEKGSLGLSSGASTDVDHLVRMQLAKAKQEGGGKGELDILMTACAGPLELFQGLGQTRSVWVSVVGPPFSRRWVMGIWDHKHDFDAKKRPIQEIDLLRIQSVQADLARHHVFVLTHFDETRVRQMMTFRRMDRARDVWVEIIHLLVEKVHEKRKARQEKGGEKGRRDRIATGGIPRDTQSESKQRGKKSMWG